jgi:hypothetical protein
MATVLQHDEPAIIERINTFFGYRAIDRLHCLHTSPETVTDATPEDPKPVPTESVSDSEDLTHRVSDPKLRETLRAFGAALKAKPSDKKTR